MERIARSSLGLVCLLMACAAPALAQVVSPVQSGHYAAANINIRDYSQPPSGLFVLWYNTFVNSDKYIDRNGNQLKSFRLSQINPVLPNVQVNLDLNAYAGIPALYWASPFKILSGARYMAGVIPSYVNADASILTERGSVVVDTTITRTAGGTVSGFGDLFVAPVGLSWGFEKFDVTAMYGFYAPTGKYDKGASDNVGLGFWTHQFQAFGYYYPLPEKATAVMLGLTTEINGDVKDSKVNPGSRLSLDWGIDQYLTPQLDVGIQGGHNWQVGDDSGSDVYWDPKFHDRKNTLVFSVGYWPVPDWLWISGRYGFDYGSRQRFENQIWSLNLIFMTHALKGSGA